ncbi:hypothetical protein [Rhodococcus sp. 14-2470-1a]|uniref:hypothetical protein n=1 Tax=Rhodococcus sp. 14-2470-1a TaxID=2023150 RepID=UPI000B9BED82|nr:hypothetical protein [Rhodococcus sp. 14-2470-1a]OZF57025.1 hypothetical protein CH292_02035 [Rhodococcus sp. 14-2470-1a]
MTKRLQPHTDIVNLDPKLTEDEEFAQHMAESYPHVAEGSAHWTWQRHIFDQSGWCEKENIQPELYGHISDAPYWARAYDGFVPNRTPSQSGWESSEAEMRLRREPGKWNDDGLTLARLRLHIRQSVSSREPFLVLNMTSLDVETKDKLTKYRLTQLTLDEAIELAHLLLLTVDVARGPADEKTVV